MSFQKDFFVKRVYVDVPECLFKKTSSFKVQVVFVLVAVFRSK